MKKKNNYFTGLSKNTFLLALTSFFADISTEMLYPVLPIFLTQTLKVQVSIVGIVEGIAQATQNIVQGFSGSISDKLKNPKRMAILGYSIAAISKPFIGLASLWQIVLGARFADRLGTGIRSAPRDGLIASSADEKHRGKAFGLEGIGDNLGAFIGPLIAIVLLFSFKVNIRSIFYFAFIPGVLAVLMMLFVKNKKIESSVKTKLDITINKSSTGSVLDKFPKIYWKYIFVTALFGIGNFSNSFLILRTKSIGVPLIVTIFIYAFFNLVAALISYPAGSLSDKLGRRNILFLAFFILIITYIGFAVSSNVFIIGVLFIGYGLFQGIFRSVGKALATDLVPKPLRASGVGWYSTTVGVSGLIASVVGGQLWVTINPSVTFIYGTIFAIAGAFALLFLIPKKLNY